MRLPPFALLCLLLPLAVRAADPSQPGQEGGRSIPYARLYAPLAAVKQADPQGIVTRSVRAEPAEPGQALPAGLQVELRAGSTRQPLAVAADGAIDFPLRPEWASGDAVVWVNRPKEEVKIVEIFRMRAPKGAKLSYGQLMESLPVIERIQQQHIQIGDLMATPPVGVELAYGTGTPQSVTVGSGAQARSWSSDELGHVRVPFDAAIPASTPVTLSAPPIALQPYAQ